MDWKEAYMQQSYDACIGRSFRGLVHNLNGVNQALTLQAALFKSMFQRATDLIDAHEGDGTGVMVLNELRKLLNKRMLLAEQMEMKIELSQNIVSGALPLQLVSERGECQPLAVDKIIAIALEIMSASSFFKHTLEKRIEIAEDVPLIHAHQRAFYFVLHSLLCNAEQAMSGAEQSNPLLQVRVFIEGEWLLLTVTDSGHGISPEAAEHVFDPFYTTRTDNLGVGLTCAKETVLGLSGDIFFNSMPGETVFTVKLPLDKLVERAA